MRLVAIALLVLAACGPGSPAGPTINNKMNAEPPAPRGPDPASDDVMARDAQANQTKVKHVLIGWRQGSGEQDPRAAARTPAQAEALAVQVLGRLRGGEPIEPLMAEFSEDPGSAADGHAYDASPDAGLVFPFKRMALRLHVDEVGMVRSEFGWHVMKRIE